MPSGFKLEGIFLGFDFVFFTLNCERVTILRELNICALAIVLTVQSSDQLGL